MLTVHNSSSRASGNRSFSPASSVACHARVVRPFSKA